MIKGYSVILDFDKSRAAGEAALLVVGTLHKIDSFASK